MTNLSLTEELISMLISKTEEGKIIWDCKSRIDDGFEVNLPGFSIRMWKWSASDNNFQIILSCRDNCCDNYPEKCVADNYKELADSRYSFAEQLGLLFNTVRNCHNARKIKEHFDLLKKVVDYLKQ